MVTPVSNPITVTIKQFGNKDSNDLDLGQIAPDLTVRMDENGTMVFANTADNLDPVTVGRLFDRFYTVEAARNSTGLGLSIAKELTERMGGHISAEYQDNKIIVQLVFLMPENQLVW